MLKRDFTYIDNIVGGLLKELSYGTRRGPPRILNIGNHCSEVVMQLVLLLKQALGRKAVIHFAPPACMTCLPALPFVPSTSGGGSIPRFVDDFRHITTVDGRPETQTAVPYHAEARPGWTLMTDKPTTLDTFLANRPKLHSWDGGKTWNDGGVTLEAIAAIAQLCTTNRVTTVVETGAGNSTLCFILAGCPKIVTIEPDAALLRRIRAYCQGHGLPHAGLEALNGPSDVMLPKLAEEWHVEGKTADVVLIDGDHSWPAVFVDFCYLYKLLRVDGFLIVDDIHLHSVKELARFLVKAREFRVVRNLRKTIIFQKVWQTSVMSGFTGQTYLKDRTAEDEAGGRAFQLF